jgi:hypothetical protein
VIFRAAYLVNGTALLLKSCEFFDQWKSAPAFAVSNYVELDEKPRKLQGTKFRERLLRTFYKFES